MSLAEHYEKHWGTCLRELRFGPRIEAFSPAFRVLVYAPSKEYLIYATDGMSLPNTEHRLEAFILSAYPDQETEAAEVLPIVARFHLAECVLDAGHTVNIGRPIVEGATCTHGLFSLPHLYGPALEWASAPSVRCLWFLPITLEERDYKMEFGLEALEQTFENSRFNYLDWGRKSVV